MVVLTKCSLSDGFLNVVAWQLLGLQEQFSAMSSRGKENLSHRLHDLFPRLLELLSSAYNREPEGDVANWTELLRDRPILWTNDAFIELKRLAFEVRLYYALRMSSSL